MTVLVTAASKYGSTAEIGQAIAEELTKRGVRATYLPAAEVDDLRGYDAVVLGSAIYAGRWRPEAQRIVDTQADVLRERPVWLFSSGPVGDPEPKPAGGGIDLASVVESTNAREHRVFAGKLDKKQLNLIERVIVTLLRVQEGDFRDWEEIRRWAGEIAEGLAQRKAQAQEGHEA
jgi:menaquinone-dependent protoporphyrinogen oxidase